LIHRIIAKKNFMSHLIVALIIVLVTIIIPSIFILIHYAKVKKRKEQMLNFFRKLGSLHNLSFTSQEILRNKIIGLDGLQRKILIAEDNKHQYDSKIIDLGEVKTCKIKKIYNAIQTDDSQKNKPEGHLNAIVLEFNFKNENAPFALEFYKDIKHSVYEMAELESKAQHWETMLLKMMSTAEQKSA
jgi:hypothetical protein